MISPSLRTSSGTAPDAELVIVSDVRLYREGLALNLASRAGVVEVVGVCSRADDALKYLERHPCAILLFDMGMEGALTEIRRLRRREPGVTLLALAFDPTSEVEIIEAAEAGIGGYIPPDASLDDLMTAVQHAARGEMLCSPSVAGTLMRSVAALAAGQPRGVAVASLTARELEVLELLDGGLSNKQIAKRLSIRIATVKNHVHSILAKLNVRRRGEAVAVVRGERAQGSDQRSEIALGARSMERRTRGVKRFPVP